MGAFDDLIPGSPGGGAFDDLIPAKAEGQTRSALASAWSQTKDLGASALSGLVSAAKLPAMAADRAVSGQWFGPGVEALTEAGESVDAQKSDDLRRREQERQNIIQSAGRMANSIAGGGDGLLATGAREGGEAIASAATIMTDPALLSNALAQQLGLLGISKIGGRATAATADAAASLAPRVASTAAGRAATAGAGTAGAVGTGAMLQGSDVGSDAYTRIKALPDAVWATAPEFVEMAKTVGPDAAKEALSNDKAFMAAFQAGLASVLSSMLPGGAAMEKALAGRPGAVVGFGQRAKAVGSAVVGEARQEAIEEGLGRVASNEAVKQINPAQSLSEGVGSAMGEGGALGGMMGGAMTAGRMAMDARRPGAAQNAGPPADQPGADPGAGPAGSQATPPADGTPIDADEVLGEAPSMAPIGADSTLHQSPPLVKAEPPTEPPLPDPLTAEPSAPTALPPVRSVPGLATTFTTETGSRLEANYALVEADELQTSHDTSLRANPNYPPELQPRQRERAASAQQISSIVGRLDPARLGLSADAATGAPIIGEDGLVESGNARTIAVKRVYQADGQKAEDYRAYLRANAAQFGLSPEQIDGMQRPVLVRVRATPVNRAEFARQANASTVAQMAPSEMAKSDSNRIDSLEDLRPDDQGDFATSRDFIRRFMGKLPGTEQAGMIDANGRLSSAGYARVRNAVLAKAYGDSPVLTRMVESMDDNQRNITKALMIAAPRVAQARSAIAEGRRFDADITPHLVGAAESLSSLKESGTSVDDALAQAGLLGDEFSPETRELLRFLAENTRRPRKIADFIGAYFDALDAAGDPAQGSLLGETQAPTTTDLMGAARRSTGAPDEAGNATNAQRRNDREAAPAGDGAAGQPQDAQGRPGGAEGDGAAGAGAARQGQVVDLAAARAEATAEFKAAAADLVDILSKHQRAAMVPENTPGLMPTLVRLSAAAIKVVGTNLKMIRAYVRDQLKSDPATKPWWNKVSDDLYRKAALQALEQLEGGSGLFGGETAKPDAALIDGRPYDMKRDNFKPPRTDEFLQAELLDLARGYVAKFAKDAPPLVVDPADRAEAEAVIKPLLERAASVKVAYDQKIIDIAQRTGAMGQLIAPLKGIKRAAEKLLGEPRTADGALDGSSLKDLLRSTIVVSSYDEAQAVVDEIRREFTVLPGRIKNRTDREITGPEVRNQGFLPSGYGDVLINVAMPNGSTAEIQINVPEMLSAKENEGHKLYEVERDQPDGSDLKAAVVAAQSDFYAAAARAAAERASAAARKKNASLEGAPDRGSESASRSSPDASSSLKTRPSGNRTQSSPEKSATNSQPSGSLSGSFIAPSPVESVPQNTELGYAQADLFGDANATRNDRTGAQGSGAETARGTEGERQTQRAPAGARGAGGRSGDRRGAAAAAGREMGQPGLDGVGQADADGGKPGARGRARRGAAVPAGRDIKPKSGRNYRLTDADLTYQGSWQKKAERNIDAVELLKKLQAEGRQATAAEQRVLAQFIGWGSSEIANNLFGKKLDKDAEALRQYARAVEAFEKRGNRPMAPTRYSGYLDGYYDALAVLRNADPSMPSWGTPEITRDALDKAAPAPATRRWVELRDRLKAALTADEWAAASRTTQYAHFTSGPVVRSMWAAMERFGFKGGTVLEPGAGSGVFPGLMPDAIAASSAYTGIEYDPITGGILQQLQPDERILVESFVDTKLPRNFYDVAIGNPPFSGTKILSDPAYAKNAFALHDYFFAKTIDSVKPGGLVMFVTSRYTMDKKGDKARAYMAERADLVGAIRLPQTAFQANAGTEVVTDVLFLRKKVPGETFDKAQPWLNSVETQAKDGPAWVNEYFAKNPSMVLGTPALRGSMYSANEYTVLPPDGDIEALFAKAVESLPADIYTAPRGSAAEAAKVRELDFNPKAKKEGNYYVTDAGVLMQRENGVGVRVDLKSPKDIELLKDFVPLRDALKQAHYDQLNDGEWEASLKSLQAAYKTFVSKNGDINQSMTRQVRVKVDELDENGDPTGRRVDDVEERRVYPLLNKLQDDPDWTLVAALEKVNEETGAVSPGSFLTSRVLGKPAVAQVATPSDALLSVLNDTGKVDVDAIAERLDMDTADAIAALGSAIYQNPEGDWETADEYLSGNVKRKLEVAEAAARADRRFERNVEALRAAQPAAKNPSQISIATGMNWIPGQYYADFLREKAGVKARIQWNEASRQWAVSFGDGTGTARATADWGTPSRHAGELMEHALTGRPIKITKSVGSGADRKSVFDPDATEAANAKLEVLKDAFATWVWEDAARADTLTRAYNDKFNTTVPRSFDGRHLTLPGASQQFEVFDHVKRGAWRIVQSGNTYLAHAVGSGKTFQMVISAMEQKRLGMIEKPMVVVPNHMLQQFAREWQELYPAAKLMVADEHNFHTENRRRWVSRVALSDLDGVIITHSAFKLLDLDPEYKSKVIEEQLDYLRAALEEAGVDESELRSAGGFGARKKTGSRDPRVKQIERQIENLEEKLKKALSSVGKDQNVRFDETGVDMLYVDEAHAYRKLDFGTARQVKGISPEGSTQALDLYIKARYLEDKQPGRSLVMASGTPVTNTLAELYTVQRFLGRQALIERGIEDFDSWASMFGRERTSLEANAAGKYEPVTRFSKFVNVPELTQMFREFADVVTGDQLAALLGDKRPKVDGGSRKIIVTPKTKAYADYQKALAARYEASRAWKPSKGEPNNPDPVIKIIGDGRLAAIDMRFVNPGMPSDPGSKLNRLIDDVIGQFKSTADLEYHDKKTGDVEAIKGATMMVFSDLGFGAGVAATRGFNARAWFEKRLRDAGVPMGQVAFMSDYKKSTDKLKLFRDLNAGRVRILIGSSKNMGTGVNAQQRLLNLFHLDSPWFPADLEQREGRIIRQGNKNKQVRIHAYAAKGSYDETMWGMLARKQFFIDQALAGDENLREVEDLDSVGQYDMAAALVAEDPRVLQLAGLKAEAEKLQRLYRAHEDQRQRFREEFRNATVTAEFLEKLLPEAVEKAKMARDISGDRFVAKAGKQSFSDRSKWGEALKAEAADLAARVAESQTIGDVSGFPVRFVSTKTDSDYRWHVQLDTPEPAMLISVGDEHPVGMSLRATNAVADVARAPERIRGKIQSAKDTADAVRPRLETPFPMLEMLAGKLKEASDLEAEIAASSKDRPWRVERKDTGLGFEVQAHNAERAIEKAIETNGGAAEDWTAVENPKPEDAQADGTKLSRGAGAGAAMSYRDLLDVAAKVSSRLPGLPNVNVLRSPADAPQALREFIERRGATADVEGALHEGQIYLFASGIADATRAEHVLAEHEAAHAGLRALLGQRLKAAMQAIANENADIRRLARPLIEGGMSVAEAVEEVIVDIPSGRLARLKGWRMVVGKVRDALKARGFERLAAQLDRWLAGHLTDQQQADLFVADLVREARAFVARKSGAGRPAGTVLSRAWHGGAAGIESFSPESIGAGDGGATYGWGAYFASLREVAEVYRDRLKENGGAAGLYQVDVPEDDGRYLNWEAAMSDQAPQVRQALAKLGIAVDDSKPADSPDIVARQAANRKWAEKYTPKDVEKTMAVLWRDRVTRGAYFVSDYKSGKDAYRELEAKLGSARAASLALHEAGVPGVKFLDATIQNVDSFNYTVFDPTVVRIEARLSRAASSAAPQTPTPAQRAETLIQTAASTPAPLDAAFKVATKVTGIERAAAMLYGLGARLIERITPERVKAGIVSDYGVPEAVIDQRAQMQGSQRQQLKDAGQLLEKLATMTRAESRVAYEWMSGDDTRTADELMKDLPEESVKVLEQVREMVDKLSQEAMRLGQLDPEAFKRHRFAYLRRSYFKHEALQNTDSSTLTGSDRNRKARAISILGDQYKGRGMTAKAPMRQIQNVAPEWWKRKMVPGKADTSLKGEKFERLERRAPRGDGTIGLEGMGENTRPGKLLEVHFWPAGEAKPAKYADWESAGIWEVRDTKAGDLVMWRDFTKAERVKMGEIDEARYAIAKTLHRMVHDVEVGRYLEWLSQRYAKKPGEEFAGKIVDASERFKDAFTPGEWVQVPDTEIPGTSVQKYGALAGRYLPGPIWNDLRQVVNGRFMPLGENYQRILSMWKTAKTALTPGVHTNNVMSNFVMADWHDVSAGHVSKALRIILAAQKGDGKGALGRIGNAAARLGIKDREAAREVLSRYQTSGGAIGGWITQEIANDQLEPIIATLQAEVSATAANSAPAEIGVYSALQHVMHARFGPAWEAFKASRPAAAVATDAKNLIDLYQAEDDVFRLAAWLKAKEEGASDAAAGKASRRSFLDYSINAPWVAAMRSTAFPFIAYTYRAAPMLLDTFAKKPHKIFKLMALAGALDLMATMFAGDGDDEERKLLPEEKAGRIWGMVPKLIRMPWNDAQGSPVYLDIRRWIPVGDVVDVTAGSAAIPLPPALYPSGPAMILIEVIFNKSIFTQKEIVLGTDTAKESAVKVIDHLWKAATPNVLGAPGTYATEGVMGAVKGRTDAFGREMSVPMAVTSAFGVKLGAYPADVMRRNLLAKARGEEMELDRQISQLKRQRATNRIDDEEFASKLQDKLDRKADLKKKLAEKIK